MGLEMLRIGMMVAASDHGAGPAGISLPSASIAMEIGVDALPMQEEAWPHHGAPRVPMVGGSPERGWLSTRGQHWMLGPTW